IADIGNLAAEVEVHQLQRLGQVALFQVVKRFKNLAYGQSELRSEPGARLPTPRAFGGELDADANDGLYVELLGIANDALQFREFLHHRNNLFADFPGQDGHFDEFIILEAVADDRRVGSVGQSENRQQFGFGAGFQAKVERPAKIEDFLDHVPLLIHLDRIDAAVVALVSRFFDSGAEGVVNFADAMTQNI